MSNLDLDAIEREVGLACGTEAYTIAPHAYALIAALRASREREERAREVVQEVEWGHELWGNGGHCPSCKYHTSAGHANDCRLAAVLHEGEEGE